MVSSIPVGYVLAGTRPRPVVAYIGVSAVPARPPPPSLPASPAASCGAWRIEN